MNQRVSGHNLQSKPFAAQSLEQPSCLNQRGQSARYMQRTVPWYVSASPDSKTTTCIRVAFKLRRRITARVAKAHPASHFGHAA